MAQQDHLLYFNIRARGEPTRMLYALAGKEFKDETTTFEEWVTTSSSKCSHYIVVRHSISNQIFGHISELLKTLPARREGLYK